MITFVRSGALLLICSLVSGLALGQSVKDLSLRDILEVALQQESLTLQGLDTPQYQSSAWLAGLPSLGVSYLESNRSEGTDETEISLNLPIKSTQRRNADKALSGLSPKIQQINETQRELYLSGLLREAIWSHRIAISHSQFALEKQQLLKTLIQQQQDLLAVNASSAYAVLLLEREQVNAQISAQEYIQQASQWKIRFRQITGLSSMPQAIKEASAPKGNFQIADHPKTRELDSAYEQQRQLMIAGSEGAKSWQVSLHAKNLSAGNFDENQYGVAVEMPLSFIKMQSQAHNSEWRAARRDYRLAHERLTIALHNRWQVLSRNAQMLQEKQSLLARASGISDQIAAQVADLLASNEINQDIAVRRRLEAIDIRASGHINLVLINQNNAMLRQAAGLPL